MKSTIQRLPNHFPTVEEAEKMSRRNVRRSDYSDIDPKVMKSAQGMEAMFINHLVTTMRKSVPNNPMSLDSSATKIYQSMLDSEHAEKASKTGGFGLAEQIVDYLDSAGYNVRRQDRMVSSAQRGKPRDIKSSDQAVRSIKPEPTGDRSTGGTDENRSIESVRESVKD